MIWNIKNNFKSCIIVIGQAELQFCLSLVLQTHVTD